MMDRGVVRVGVLTYSGQSIEESGVVKSWASHCLVGMVVLSLMMIVYINFANRVNTARLNGLLAQGSRLQAKRDGLTLDKERLLMHHHVESKAQEKLGYQLNKHVKIIKLKK